MHCWNSVRVVAVCININTAVFTSNSWYKRSSRGSVWVCCHSSCWCHTEYAPPEQNMTSQLVEFKAVKLKASTCWVCFSSNEQFHSDLGSRDGERGLVGSADGPSEHLLLNRVNSCKAAGIKQPDRKHNSNLQNKSGNP